jgi:hypothetical protein
MITRLLSPLLFALFALAAVPAIASPPPDDDSTGYVFAGTCDNGSWSEPKLENLPSCATAASAADFRAKIAEGLAVRSEPGAKSGTIVDKLRAGVQVRVVKLYATSVGDGPRYYWAQVKIHKQSAEISPNLSFDRVVLWDLLSCADPKPFPNVHIMPAPTTKALAAVPKRMSRLQV